MGAVPGLCGSWSADQALGQLEDLAVRRWLGRLVAMHAEPVDRDRRSPTTLALYRNVVERLVRPALGSLRMGELTTPLLDRFVQGVLVEKGVATAKLCRSVLSGCCGWLVRQGVFAANPVRDLTPLEVGGDRTANAMTATEVGALLQLLDESEFARRHDLPELVRFMLATGLRVGEAIGA